MGKFQSSKVFDGFSTVSRQWKAEDTPYKFVHGYEISFKVYFEGKLDGRDWVWDFGGMENSKTQIDNKTPKAWMDYMFDHTMIIAADDPELQAFQQMDKAGVAQVRVIPSTGAEKLAEYIYDKMNEFIKSETGGRVRVTKVKFMGNEKNAAYFCE